MFPPPFFCLPASYCRGSAELLFLGFGASAQVFVYSRTPRFTLPAPARARLDTESVKDALSPRGVQFSYPGLFDAPSLIHEDQCRRTRSLYGSKIDSGNGGNWETLGAENVGYSPLIIAKHSNHSSGQDTVPLQLIELAVERHAIVAELASFL